MNVQVTKDNVTILSKDNFMKANIELMSYRSILVKNTRQIWS